MNRILVALPFVIALLMIATDAMALHRPDMSDPDQLQEVTEYNAASGRLQVDGQNYRVTSQTVVRTEDGETVTLRVGDRIAVVQEEQVQGEAMPVAREIWVHR